MQPPWRPRREPPERRRRASSATVTWLSAAALWATSSAVALTDAHPDPKAPSLQEECHVDLPIASTPEQRKAAKGVLVANLPSFKQGRFEDFDVVNAVATHTGSTSPGGCQEDAYGELPLDWALQMFKILELGANDTFADLGSGLGKLPIAAVVLGGARRAIGVELSRKRHQLACAALVKVSRALELNLQSAPANRTARVELRLDDFLSENMTEASVVYASSVCFRKALMKMLGRRLASELPDGARAAFTTGFPSTPPARLHLDGRRKAGVFYLNVYSVNRSQRSAVPKEAAAPPASGSGPARREAHMHNTTAGVPSSNAVNLDGTIKTWGGSSRNNSQTPAPQVPLDSSMRGAVVAWGQGPPTNFHGGRRGGREEAAAGAGRIMTGWGEGRSAEEGSFGFPEAVAPAHIGPEALAPTADAGAPATGAAAGSSSSSSPAVATGHGHLAPRRRGQGRKAGHRKRRMGLKNLLREAVDASARKVKEPVVPQIRGARPREFKRVESDQQSIVNGTVVHKVVKAEVEDLGKGTPILWRWMKGFGPGDGGEAEAEARQPANIKMHGLRILTNDAVAIQGFGKEKD